VINAPISGCLLPRYSSRDQAFNTMSKTQFGNFFEDFAVGQSIVHATPRTITAGDVAMYNALFGSRFPLYSSDPFAQSLGLDRAPVDCMLVFHMVFGKTVPDISLNAIANLGYAEGRFGDLVFPGDTIATTSKVIGVKQNRDGKTGIVWVHSVGTNQRGAVVLEYKRWVLVRKRNADSPAPEPVIPALQEAVPVDQLIVPFALALGAYDHVLAGSPFYWDDYAVGERIDHVDGVTIEDAEHMMAARLYQNTARVHFNHHVEREGRFGRRIVYGGHIVSMARALSFNGLANAMAMIAVNGGRHVNPSFAGDTIYAWSEILDRHPLPERSDLGVLRLRTIALKDCPPQGFREDVPVVFPRHDATGEYDPSVVLDFDYTVVVPRRV
jgi:2-methylfumaryl-CoA hydratase